MSRVCEACGRNLHQDARGTKDEPAHVIVRMSESQLVAMMAAQLSAPMVDAMVKECAENDSVTPNIDDAVAGAVAIARRIRKLSKEEP